MIDNEILLLLMDARNYVNRNNPWFHDPRFSHPICRFCGADKIWKDGEYQDNHEPDCEHVKLRKQLNEFVDRVLEPKKVETKGEATISHGR